MSSHAETQIHTGSIISLLCILPPGWTSHNPIPTQPAQGLAVSPPSPERKRPSSSQLALPAACGRPSWSIARQPRQHSARSAPRAHLLQRANVQRQDDTAICSHPSFLPLQRDSVTSCVTEAFCHWACGVQVRHDIMTLHQHNGGSCQGGPWITFRWYVWPDGSITLYAYWPDYALYSRETLSGCHVTSGFSQAEKKGFGLFHTCSLCTCQTKSPLTEVVDCTTVRATTSY